MLTPAATALSQCGVETYLGYRLDLLVHGHFAVGPIRLEASGAQHMLTVVITRLDPHGESPRSDGSSMIGHGGKQSAPMPGAAHVRPDLPGNDLADRIIGIDVGRWRECGVPDYRGAASRAGCGYQESIPRAGWSDNRPGPLEFGVGSGECLEHRLGPVVVVAPTQALNDCDGRCVGRCCVPHETRLAG